MYYAKADWFVGLGNGPTEWGFANCKVIAVFADKISLDDYLENGKYGNRERISRRRALSSGHDFLFADREIYGTISRAAFLRGERP